VREQKKKGQTMKKFISVLVIVGVMLNTYAFAKGGYSLKGNGGHSYFMKGTKHHPFYKPVTINGK